MKFESDEVVKVDGLHKKFCRVLRRSMFYGAVDTTKAMMGVPINRGLIRPGEFWALEDVSFEVRRAQALGIVGQNGSGKTTLLRLINGIFPPDRGTIATRGRIGALIAVGAGFHPHLTGRENIFLNATILGMSKQEIQKKFDEIIAFADIGQFLDAPVATYSSGMSVRLGFAIAVHAAPEILVADEVLAVGDLSFALKCYRKISEYRERGGCILLVSHSIQLVRNTCQKVLWLEGGRTKEYGDTQRVCDKYENFMLEKSGGAAGAGGARINNDPTARVISLEFIDPSGASRLEHRVGDRMVIRIRFDCERKVELPVFTLSIADPENIQVISNYTSFDGFNPESIEGKGYLDFVIDRLPLKPSEYRCTVTLSDHGSVNRVLDWHDRLHRFRVVSNGATSYGLFNPFPRWVSDKDRVLAQSAGALPPSR